MWGLKLNLGSHKRQEASFIDFNTCKVSCTSMQDCGGVALSGFGKEENQNLSYSFGVRHYYAGNRGGGPCTNELYFYGEIIQMVASILELSCGHFYFKHVNYPQDCISNNKFW